MATKSPIRARIERLLDSQRFGVLCVAQDARAYGALVAFAHDEPLTTLYFSTPVTTRKYRFLAECDSAAFLVDDRSERGDELMGVAAVTVVGPASELDAGTELDAARERLTKRHPEMRAYFEAHSSAVFKLEIVRAIHVGRFQEVEEWTPADAG